MKRRAAPGGGDGVVLVFGWRMVSWCPLSSFNPTNPLTKETKLPLELNFKLESPWGTKPEKIQWTHPTAEVLSSK